MLQMGVETEGWSNLLLPNQLESVSIRSLGKLNNIPVTCPEHWSGLKRCHFPFPPLSCLPSTLVGETAPWVTCFQPASQSDHMSKLCSLSLSLPSLLFLFCACLIHSLIHSLLTLLESKQGSDCLPRVEYSQGRREEGKKRVHRKFVGQTNAGRKRTHHFWVGKNKNGVFAESRPIIHPWNWKRLNRAGWSEQLKVSAEWILSGAGWPLRTPFIIHWNWDMGRKGDDE